MTHPPPRSLALLAALALLAGAIGCGPSRGRGGGGGGGGRDGGGDAGGDANVPDAGSDAPVDAARPDITRPDAGAWAQAETVSDTPVGLVAQVRHEVPGRPFDTVLDYQSGPASWENRYGQHRQLFPVRHGDEPGVVWQDQGDGTVRVTWLSDADPAAHRTLPLRTPEDMLLGAAASDDEGQLYVLVVEVGDGAPRTPRDAWLLKFDAEGEALHRRELGTGSHELNVVQFGDLGDARYHAVLRWSEGLLGLMLGRRMVRSDDGLNHQGGIAVVFGTGTMRLLANHGQTSGHSFSNKLAVDGRGRFLGLDLGDGYPRGVHLHRFDLERCTSRVVYTVKTLHGTTPRSPSGVAYEEYQEISGDGVTYYRWSNDNATYTELGGVAETPEGLAVVFSTERSGLDNSRAGEGLNDPRDLALLLVRSDFDRATRGDGPNVVTDDLVLSQGDPPEEGGYYGFAGTWHPQRNVGAVWLTDYPDTSRNASRVKLHRLDETRLLVAWEEWGPHAYKDTLAMVVRPDGSVVTPAASLGESVRFGAQEELFEMAGGVAHVGGDGRGELVVTVLFP